MDDLDYSVYIADHDWSNFFQESEECDLLQASLATLDDSGLSEPDDAEGSPVNLATQPLLEAPSVECCLNTEGPQAPEGNSSGKKEDMWLEPECLPSKNPTNHNSGEDQCNNDATLRPSWSGLRAIPGDPQMDLQMPPKAEPGRTDCLGNRNEMPRKEKERWFVTMDIGKTYSRENVGMSAKKKRKKRCRRSSVELGLGFGGWGPGIQSESEAERYGAAQPLGEQTSWEPESFQSGGECIVRTDDTRQQFQGLSAKQQLVSPSANRSSNTRLLSEDTNFTKPTKSVRASVAYKGSLLPQGQQGTTEDACLDSTTALPGTSDLKYLNEITTETDHNGLHVICRNCAASDSGRKRENRGGVEQLMNAEKLTRAGSVPNLDTEKNVEAMQPPLFDSEDEGPAVDPDSGIGSTESCASQEPLTLDPTHPVYALSPFWDEMEKLTINDILHLRLVGHAQPPKELPRNAVADTSDAADSDYFTQPDESKPNRSSSEFSTLSDFEEEFSQALNTSTNPSPEPQAHGSARPPSSRNDRVRIILPSLIFRGHVLRSTELMEKNTKISPPFLDSKALTANFNIPSTEIIGNSVHGNEATVSPLGTSSVACFTHEDAEKLSVPEMYDCFFSDFETGSFFFPLARRCNKNKTSSFRPDDEDDREPIRAATRVGESVGEPTGAACAPDTYEQFCTDSDWRGDLFWRNPLSLRWTCFLGGGLSRPHGSFISWQSLAFKGRGSSLFSRSTSQGDQECLPCTDHLETRMFAQSAERTRGSLLPSLQHADLCLVCIAFASWVLKSINPQDADTWKTVLLANMSAVSAIRYLRQSSSDSAPHHEPRPTYEP
uniref:PGC-1 and ERR-induced regulator in muscle protein 1-like n=1 Tax=Scleropages formosus TaxID=113540 RepID=A0A8C9SR09_SCLFO